MHTPARVNTRTGVCEINPEYFNNIPIHFQNDALNIAIEHEKQHYLQRHKKASQYNELLADEMAVYNYVKKGGSLKNAIRAYLYFLDNEKNSNHIERINNVVFLLRQYQKLYDTIPIDCQKHTIQRKKIMSNQKRKIWERIHGVRNSETPIRGLKQAIEEVKETKLLTPKEEKVLFHLKRACSIIENQKKQLNFNGSDEDVFLDQVQLTAQTLADLNEAKSLSDEYSNLTGENPDYEDEEYEEDIDEIESVISDYADSLNDTDPVLNLFGKKKAPGEAKGKSPKKEKASAKLQMKQDKAAARAELVRAKATAKITKANAAQTKANAKQTLAEQGISQTNAADVLGKYATGLTGALGKVGGAFLGVQVPTEETPSGAEMRTTESALNVTLPENTPTDTEKGKEDKISMWWWIGGGAGVVAIIALIIFFVLRSKANAE